MGATLHRTDRTCRICETNPAATSNRMSICWTCWDRRKRARHPDTYLYHNLKKSARQRGWDVLFSLHEWRNWCRCSNFITLHEIYGCVVGRLNHAMPYTLDNIAPMLPALNARLGDWVPPEGADMRRVRRLLWFNPDRSVDWVMQQIDSL